MVPCLRCSARIWGETNPIHILQAFVVAGGWNAWTQAGRLSSVLTLISGTPAWTPLASLPRPLYTARASVVGGRLRVTGGRHGVTYRSEVLELHLGSWTTVGELQQARGRHGALSIGIQEPPCVAAETTTSTMTETTTTPTPVEPPVEPWVYILISILA